MRTPSRLALGGSVLLCGTLMTGLAAHGDPPIVDKLPTLRDTIVYQNEFGTYVDQPPFVQTVNWNHPLIKSCEAAFGQWNAQGVEVAPGIGRSTMSYGDHLKTYGLNEADDWNNQKGLYHFWNNKPDSAEKAKKLAEIDRKVARANYQNFVKTLLGEYRDYPFMIKTKLEVVASHTPTNKKGAQTAPSDQKFLFDTLTGDGYARLRWILDEVYEARLRKLNPTPSRFNYSWNEVGHVCNRTDNSVKPTTHAEMRYIFAEWLRGPSKQFNIDQYEQGLQRFIQQNCDPSPTGPDLGYMYDFRGDKNFKANWMECNSFIWNSRHYCRKYEGEKAKGLTPDPAYFRRPFATRYARTRELLAAYLYYPNSDHQNMKKASESGGGCHVYFENEDANGDGVSDYRIFPDVMGQGDIGLESQALPNERVNAQPSTRTTTANFNRTSFNRETDFGFNKIFTVTPATRNAFKADGVFSDSDSDQQATFKLRMARLCTALDRHTNWGPSQMFSATMFGLNKRYAIRGAYSPIVAMSYEISKSHNFAVGDFPGTHPRDQGKVKWMFFVRFQSKYYYDERDVKAGNKKITWTRSYLNESSLSNDYYNERALDKLGWIPASDMSTACYLAEADGEDSYYPTLGLTDTINPGQ